MAEPLQMASATSVSPRVVLARRKDRPPSNSYAYARTLPATPHDFLSEGPRGLRGSGQIGATAAAPRGGRPGEKGP